MTFRVRSVLLLMTALTVVGLIFLRATALQIGARERMRALVEKEVWRDVRIPARRGDIKDRHDAILASSVEVASISANPMSIEDPRQVAQQLAPILNLAGPKLYDRLGQERLFVWLKRQVDPKIEQAIAALDIEGIEITKEFKRYYPQRDVAGRVLGFVNIDGTGLEGIELGFNQHLSGTPRVVSTLRDKRGRLIFEQDPDAEGRNRGQDLRLTIDVELQHHAENVLREALLQHNASAAYAVVVDVRRSELLALAQAPTFNPNQKRTGSPERWRNRAVADAYELGSVFKPLVVAAAMNEGLTEPKSRYWVRRKPKSKAQWHNTEEILKHSINEGAAEMGRLLGAQRVHTYFRGLGFGAPPQLGLPGETAGILPPWSQWSAATVMTSSYGYGVSVSLIQLAAAYACIARHGVYKPIRLLMSGKDSDAYVPGLGRQVFEPETIKALTPMLSAVVNDGSGFRAQIPGIQVAGKTGTAEKRDPVSGGYNDALHMSSFAGYFPAADPELVVVVMLDEPKPAYFGGEVAAPAFARIAGYAAARMGIERDPNYIQAALWRLQHGERTDTGAAIVAPQEPALDGASNLDASEAANDENRVLPNLQYLTAREVAMRLNRLKKRPSLSFYGHGVVASQNPAPGTPWERVEALHIHLESR